MNTHLIITILPFSLSLSLVAVPLREEPTHGEVIHGAGCAAG